MENLGVGSVERSSVDSIMILLLVLNFQQVVIIMIQAAVRMNQDLNKKTTVAGVIIVIAVKGGNII